VPLDDPGPGASRYDPRTALIVVDVQNDFADPSGSLFVAGGHEVAEVVNEQVAAAIDAGALVVYTQDWHPKTTPHFRKDGGIWPVHCVGGTWGAEFVPALRVRGEVVRKGVDGRDGYSAFSVRDPIGGETTPTSLERILREGDVERIVIVGLATDYCVVETALDARRLGFETVVVSDAIRAVDLEPGDGERALERMREAGTRIE
jgi:nicotinamidase/pyrazinamidase